MDDVLELSPYRCVGVALCRERGAGTPLVGWADREGVRTAYWRLLYHLVWATYEREPRLTPDGESFLYRILGGKASELEVFVHSVGNTSDHVHLVVGIPPKLAVSECVRQLKGASSHALNRRHAPFRWQEGYGALTLCDEILPTVIAYVRNQKRHHQVGSVDIRFERDTDEGNIPSP